MVKKILFAVLPLLLFAASPAQAGSVSSFGAEKPLTLDDFRPHLRGEMAYTEEWSHGVWLDDGGDMGIDYVITNFGIGNHRGAFHVEYRDENGKMNACKTEYSEDDWSSDPKAFHLKFGGNELSGDLTGLQLKIRCDPVSMDLTFKNDGTPFQPGSGKLTYEKDGNEDGFYSIMYTSPRAIVTGSVAINGVTKAVQGIGLGDHSITNLRTDNLARRWFKFNSIGKDHSIFLAELESPAKYSSSREGWALVYGSEGRILASPRVRFDYDGFILDNNSEEGYRIPRRVRVSAVNGNTSLTGTLLMTGVKEVRDPTDDLNAFLKMLVHKYTKPRDYYIKCSFDFKIMKDNTPKEIQGERFFRYIYMNP